MCSKKFKLMGFILFYRLWREKCKEYEVEIESEESNNSKKQNDRENFVGEVPHKKMFLKQYKVEMNWRYKPVKTPKHLKGHDDHVITCLQFDGNKIVSGSDDNTLKVWSALTGNIIRTLVGHTGENFSFSIKYFFFFLVSCAVERPWWPIQSLNKGRKKKVKG